MFVCFRPCPPICLRTLRIDLSEDIQAMYKSWVMQVSIHISMQVNCAGTQYRQLEKGTLWFQSIATCIHTSIGVALSVHRLLVVLT